MIVFSSVIVTFFAINNNMVQTMVSLLEVVEAEQRKNQEWVKVQRKDSKKNKVVIRDNGPFTSMDKVAFYGSLP
jgi:hypothetical protein